MNPKDARAVAALIRREHGPRADAFCERMIRYFDASGRTLLADTWRAVHGYLAASTRTPEGMPVVFVQGFDRRQNAVANHINGAAH